MSNLNHTNESNDKFNEGDILYTFFEKQFHIYKLLKVDNEFSVYHVLCYKPVDQLPDAEKMNELDISVYHTPIAADGFEGAKVLSKGTLSDDDFMGYFEYLKQTNNVDELVRIANNYYKEAYRLTDLKEHEAAIQKYSIAIDLIPNFYEAIDNRAFCKMDLARWNEAIEDFKLSLSVNPVSLLAEFSIGECYFKMGDYKNAIKQFEKAIEIDPTHPAPQDFLKRAREMEKK